MSVIAWSDALPSDTNSAGSADDEFRSMLTAIAVGLGESFFWPGSAPSQGASTASSGELRPGSARLGVNIASKPISGLLSMASTPNAVIHNQTGAVMWLGQPAMLDRASGIGNAPFDTRWVVQTGTVTTSNGEDAVAFSVWAYTGIPNVMVGPGALGRGWEFGIHSVQATGFTLKKTYVESGSPTTPIFYWRSEGTVAF